MTDKWDQLEEKAKQVARDELYGFPHVVIRMSTSDLQEWSLKSILQGQAPQPLPDGALIGSIYGIPVETDDTLNEPEIIYR